MWSLRGTPFLKVLWLAWILVSTTSTTAVAATSTKLLNFIDLLSQEFDNQWQVEEDERYERPRHSHLNILYIPAKVPALPTDNTLLVLEFIENQMKRLNVDVVVEDPDGVIRVLSYNITSTGKFSVDSVDSIDLSGLLNLTPEDLVEREECEGTFSEIEPNVFLGRWPDCRDQHTEVIPQYKDLITCGAFSGFSQPGDLEVPTTVPYILKSQRRFLMLPEMLAGVPNYSSPCPEN